MEVVEVVPVLLPFVTKIYADLKLVVGPCHFDPPDIVAANLYTALTEPILHRLLGKYLDVPTRYVPVSGPRERTARLNECICAMKAEYEMTTASADRCRTPSSTSTPFDPTRVCKTVSEWRYAVAIVGPDDVRTAEEGRRFYGYRVSANEFVANVIAGVFVLVPLPDDRHTGATAQFYGGFLKVAESVVASRMCEESGFARKVRKLVLGVFGHGPSRCKDTANWAAADLLSRSILTTSRKIDYDPDPAAAAAPSGAVECTNTRTRIVALGIRGRPSLLAFYRAAVAVDLVPVTVYIPGVGVRKNPGCVSLVRSFATCHSTFLTVLSSLLGFMPRSLSRPKLTVVGDYSTNLGRSHVLDLAWTVDGETARRRMVCISLSRSSAIIFDLIKLDPAAPSADLPVWTRWVAPDFTSWRPDPTATTCRQWDDYGDRSGHVPTVAIPAFSFDPSLYCGADLPDAGFTSQVRLPLPGSPSARWNYTTHSLA